MLNFRLIPFELIFWAGSLIVLFLSQGDHHHFSICPFYNLGITWCPGCGMGRSLTAILHGNIAGSIRHHWFGIPALIILLHRICYLFRKLRLTLLLTKS